MPAIGSMEPVRTRSAEPVSRAGAADESIRSKLQAAVSDKHVLVFSGFSGAGYKDVPGAENLMASTLKANLERHGAHTLVVVAGATDAGIGAVYRIARELGVQTLGIVSKQARPDDISLHCQSEVYVDDPQGNWKVLSPEGASYMVAVAQMGRSAEMIFIGGGAVAASELEESLKLGIATQVHSHYESSAGNGPAPLRQWCDQHPDLLEQPDSVVHHT